MRQILTIGGLAIAGILWVAPAVRADILTVNLTQSDLPGAPGTTVDFFATITNPSATDTIYLNGDNSSTSSPLLTLDDTPYLNNAPLFLAPGASSGPFELFDVSIDPSTPAATYTGNLFSISGGADGGAGTAFDDLADVPFSVTVQPPTSAIPEPATSWWMLAVLIALAVIRWRWDRTKKCPASLRQR